MLKRLDDAALEQLLQKAEAYENKALPLEAQARDALLALSAFRMVLEMSDTMGFDI